MILKQYIIIGLAIISLCLFSALSFMYHENSQLRNELALQKSNNEILKMSIEKQNAAIEEMKIDKNMIEENYKKLHIKYEEHKASIADIEQQADEISKIQNVSKNEAILIAEKTAIQKALDAFYNRNQM